MLAQTLRPVRRVARYEDAESRLANAFRAPAAALDADAGITARPDRPGRDPAAGVRLDGPAAAAAAAAADNAVRAERFATRLEADAPVNLGALRALCAALQAASAGDGDASLSADEFLQARPVLRPAPELYPCAAVQARPPRTAARCRLVTALEEKVLHLRAPTLLWRAPWRSLRHM